MHLAVPAGGLFRCGAAAATNEVSKTFHSHCVNSMELPPYLTQLLLLKRPLSAT
jgi:hypothetical protein